MAMACLRLFTVPPFPPLPLFSVPFFLRRTALATSFAALLEYFLAMNSLRSFMYSIARTKRARPSLNRSATAPFPGRLLNRQKLPRGSHEKSSPLRDGGDAAGERCELCAAGRSTRA